MKRYLCSGKYDVEFHFWGDHITPVYKVSVVLIKPRWFGFGTKVVRLYSESHSRKKITSYQETADLVVANYKKELEKMEAVKEWG